MRAIIVEDEPIMLRRFSRLAEKISDLDLIGQFEDPRIALEFACRNTFEVAFLDVEMPQMNGIALAERLREAIPGLLIVFISAHDNYIGDSNRVGGDYYIIKPYTEETIRMTMERLRLLVRRQQKDIRIQTFGRFLVIHEGRPIPLTGKAKEILALVVTRRGREISNEEIYRTVWESREYSNYHMAVYYNALHRLRRTLKTAGIPGLLVSTAHGQTVDTSLFDCDYYEWLDGGAGPESTFRGEFMSEYSWAEPLLADIVAGGY